MPVPLARAVVAMLADWRPAPDVIVVTESASRPGLVADLAAGLARFLDRPIVGRWAIADPSVVSGQGATNSAQRVAAVSRRHRLQLDDADAVGACGCCSSTTWWPPAGHSPWRPTR